MTRFFIELRGIGIIDVKNLFGVESVKMTQSIDLVIQLEDWNKETDYDRLGLDENYIEYLGIRVWHTRCRSVREEISRLSLRPLPLITVRRRWDIMPRKNYTNE